MATARFEILTATHNRADDYLPECVESVQRLQLEGPAEHDIDFRHTVVDDASTDKTYALLEDVARKTATQEHGRIRVIHSPENVGQAAALELGYTAILNEVIYQARQGIPAIDSMPDAFVVLDDDDMITPNALQLYTDTYYQALLRSEPAPGVIFGPAIIIDEHGNELDDVPHMPRYNDVPDTNDLRSFMSRMLECNHVPSKPAIRWPYYQPYAIADGFKCHDWAIVMKALSAGATIHMVPEPTSYYRVHAGQSSNRRSTDGTWDEEGEVIRSEYNPLTPKSTAEDWQILLNALNGLPVRKVRRGYAAPNGG